MFNPNYQKVVYERMKEFWEAKIKEIEEDLREIGFSNETYSLFTCSERGEIIKLYKRLDKLYNKLERGKSWQN